jgi:hypothetical protein
MRADPIRASDPPSDSGPAPGGGRLLYLFFYFSLFLFFFSAVTLFSPDHPFPFSLSVEEEAPMGGSPPPVEGTLLPGVEGASPPTEVPVRAELSAASSATEEWITGRSSEELSPGVSPELTGPKIQRARTQILAVTRGGKGTTIPLEVELREGGEGRLLLDIKQARYTVALQESVESAYEAAMRITGIRLGDKDVLIHIGNLSTNRLLTIDGKSAGAAVAVALVAAIEGREIRPNVLITGTIEPDGKIGVVSGIYWKAMAAKEAGTDTLLVSYGTSPYIEGLEIVNVDTLLKAVKEMCTSAPAYDLEDEVLSSGWEDRP